MATSVAATEIRNRAAFVLGLRESNKTVDGNIAADLDNAYNEIYSELEADQNVYWASDAAVPNQYVKAMVDLVAWARAGEYPLSEERYKRVILTAGVDGDKPKKRIRDQAVKTWSDETVPGQYY